MACVRDLACGRPAGDAGQCARRDAASRGAAAAGQGTARAGCCADCALSRRSTVASTHGVDLPLEVVQAARWAAQNPKVTGKALEDAMAKQTWDPSVKGLVAVPQTLQMMSDKLDWTQQLGDAFLADQAAVLDAVQRLRTRAEGTGNLKTSSQMK